MPMRRSSAATNSAARRVSAACAGSVETEGMRSRALSSSTKRGALSLANVIADSVILMSPRLLCRTARPVEPQRTTHQYMEHCSGAFFTGFLVYILKRAELRPILNTAVVVGFICYSGAVAILMIDVGQPLRAWFTFWHPNTHSMLTEVTFCISCYLLVLCLEYVPILLRNRQLLKLPSFLVFEHQLHKLVPVLAGVGTLLSFFHQGSLGGLYGVLRGRPFAFREGFFIWPSTFFLFILSAIASGPSFLMLVTATVEKVTGRRLVPPDLFRRLGFISGVLLAIYVAAKSIDTLIWLNEALAGHF